VRRVLRIVAVVAAIAVVGELADRIEALADRIHHLERQVLR